MALGIFCFGSSSYLAAKAVSFLTSAPEREEQGEDTKMDRVRRYLATHKASLANWAGPKNWGYLTEVIAGNLWISAGGARALWVFSNKPFGEEKVFAVAAAFFCISILSWGVRREVAKLFAERIGQEARGSPDPAPSSQQQPIRDVSELPTVPVQLHQDIVLSQRTCPITLTPIRFPVGDPNGSTIYERASIEKWIEEHGTSPVTRAPLDRSALVPQPVLQQVINNRLAFWFFKSKLKGQLNPGGSA